MNSCSEIIFSITQPQTLKEPGLTVNRTDAQLLWVLGDLKFVCFVRSFHAIKRYKRHSYTSNIHPIILKINSFGWGKCTF